MQEAIVWRQLNHPNVLPLKGYAFDEHKYPLFVSEWMDNGSAWRYVTERPGMSPRELLRLVRVP